MNIRSAVWPRIYQDLLMRSRLDEYDALLGRLQALGYTFITMRDLASLSRSPTDTWTSIRLCVIRNDVDSDVRTARKMLARERLRGIVATYYFRLSTFDHDFMLEVAQSGSEAGYHYEEVATYAKSYGLGNADVVRENLSEVRKEFKRNLERFRSMTGYYPATVASHGDFVNRKLGMTNSEILDYPTRFRFGIEAEAYDERLLAPVDARVSDCSAPRWWNPESPDIALQGRPRCLYLLVHPRQWEANRTENVKLTLSRITEGARYASRTRRQP